MKELQQLSDDNQLKPMIMQLGVKESNRLDLSILKDLDGQIHYDRDKIHSQISKHFDKWYQAPEEQDLLTQALDKSSTLSVAKTCI